jgi:hypothetical protein
MHTDLDEDTLRRIDDIVQSVCGAIGNEVSQDNLLMLTCLQLAYNLEKVERRLAHLEGKLTALERWEPLPDEPA